jgi:ubiquinone/menaquinone biosynthesis C-methylase UbiE
LKNTVELTQRQQNELEYHKGHAKKNEAALLSQPFDSDVIKNPVRRWWNAYWQMYDYMLTLDLAGKTVLVVGCGFGEDALRIANLGADVYAFDLSPDCLDIARQLARREFLDERIKAFDQMPAEVLSYPDNFFDYIVARDILHHVDVPLAMKEIRRVAKPGATFLVDEIYSHSVTDIVRRSRFVEWLYPKVQKFVYGKANPYITEDERKLSEHDMVLITAPVDRFMMFKYFNFFVNRIVPDRFVFAAKIDRLLMMLLKPIGGLLAGRVLFAGQLTKGKYGQ